MTDPDGMGIPGVRSLAHTADVALAIDARTPEALFDRAARGLFYLVFEAVPPEAHTGDEVVFELAAPDRAMLLRDWLRRLLHLYEDQGLGYVSAVFDQLSDTKLTARVECQPVALAPVREIKGVTLHDLRVDLGPGGWRARVVFDV